MLFADLSRRRFLQAVGMSSLGGLIANSVLLAKSPRPKSFIMVWLAGGPSQLETFDPHPGTAIGGPTRAIPTRTPDVSFAHTLPMLADMSHHLAIIRSMVSKEGDHERGQYHLRTGYRPDPTLKHPSLGSILAESTNASSDLPPYISIEGDVAYSEGGFLGAAYQAYQIGDPLEPPRNLRANVDETRLGRRLKNLDLIEANLRGRDRVPLAAQRTAEETQRALRMMKSPEQAAFDLTNEPSNLRQRYGMNSFGQGCLVARRLVETGVRAVDIVLRGWDTHAENFDAHDRLTKKLDAGAATLLADLAERDLLKETLVVIAGEFGRTPAINPADGRDHWPNGFSLALAGAGVPGGQCLGATDPEGEKPPVDPVSVPDLAATLLALMGVDFRREITTPIGRPIKLAEGEPIARLLPS